MAKWTLTKTTQDGMYNKHKQLNETVYHYESGERKVAFHSHPTQAFTYVKVYGGNGDFNLILNPWIDQARKGSQYVGGFEEAVKELEVPMNDKTTIEKLPFTQLEISFMEQGLRMLHDSGTYPTPFDKNRLKLLADRVGNARSDEVKRPEKLGYYRRTKGARETVLA